MKNLATINDLNFGYKRGLTLFSNMNLSIKAGQTYGLLSKKDEGKTTLLKLLSGLLFPVSGKVEFMDYEPRLRQVKMLSNTFYLPEEEFRSSLSIKRFVKTYMPFYPKFSIGKFEGNLSDFSISIDTKDISTLSIGQRKKLMIAFALATNARLILLDEPTNGLDIASKNQLQRLVNGSLTDKNCIIISSNQAEDLDGLVENIIVLNNHKIVINQSLENVGEKLSFTLEETNENPNAYLYVKEVKGGFRKVSINTKKEKSELNLETLFDAVISNPEAIEKIFIE